MIRVCIFLEYNNIFRIFTSYGEKYGVKRLCTGLA